MCVRTRSTSYSRHVFFPCTKATQENRRRQDLHPSSSNKKPKQCVCVWGEWALKSFLGVSPTWKRIIPWYVHYIPRNHWFYTTHSVGWITIYAYIYRVGWTPMSPTWGRSSDKLGYGAPMTIVIKLSIHLNTGTALPSKSHELWLQAP